MTPKIEALESALRRHSTLSSLAENAMSEAQGNTLRSLAEDAMSEAQENTPFIIPIMTPKIEVLESALRRHSTLSSLAENAMSEAQGNTLRSLAENAMSEAQENWKEIEKQRKQKLQATLRGYGLSVCAYHTHHDVGETEREKLGLFPSLEMRLLYRETHRVHEGHKYEQIEHKMGFVALCPHHFPENPNREWQQSRVHDNQIGMTSEVVKHGDGRLFTIVDSIEVKLSVEEPRYNEEVYGYFGLPLLPEVLSDPI